MNDRVLILKKRVKYIVDTFQCLIFLYLVSTNSLTGKELCQDEGENELPDMPEAGI